MRDTYYSFVVGRELLLRVRVGVGVNIFVAAAAATCMILSLVLGKEFFFPLLEDRILCVCFEANSFLAG